MVRGALRGGVGFFVGALVMGAVTPWGSVDAGPRSSAPIQDGAAPRLMGRTPEELWYSLLTGNRRYMRGALEPKGVLGARRRLESGDLPEIAVLTCSDSAVPPEFVFDRPLGELYVVRTAGPVADAGATGSLELAVARSNVKLLVVLGHGNCSALRAAREGDVVTGAGDALVAQIRASLARSGSNPAAAAGLEDDAVLHVRATAAQLLTQSPVLASAVETRRLVLIRALHHASSGEVTRIVD